MPTELVEKVGAGIGGMLLMVVLGIPLYVCATASVPIASALLMKGVSPGVVFVFLMTGPVTNAASLTTLFKLIGRKAVLIYLLSVIISALAFGIIIDCIPYNFFQESISHLHGKNSASFFEEIGAAALSILLLISLLKKLPR